MQNKKIIDPYAAEVGELPTSVPINDVNDPYASANQVVTPRKPDEPLGDWSTANVARQVLGQGLALGFGDEIEGVVRGVYDAAIRGVPISDAIDQATDYVRSQNKAFEIGNPGAALSLQVAGGALTGFAGAGRALMKQGLSLGARSLRSAGAGSAIGGTTGAGMAEGGVLDRSVPALIGAGIGGVTGGALPGAGALAGRGIKKIARIIPGGAVRQAKGLLRNAFYEDNINAAMARKAVDEIGDISVIADAGGTAVKDLARYAGNKSGGKAAQKLLRERHIDQGPRIEASINRNMTDIPLDDFLDEMAKTRRAAANKNYGKLYESEVPLTPKLKSFFENKLVQEAYPMAQKLAAGEGKVLPDLFKVLDGGVKSYAKPTMRMLDLIKRSLDDDVSRAFRVGSGELGSVLRTLRDDFRDVVDDLVPDYKKVRSVYAGHSAAMEAAELGGKFIMTPRSVSVNAIKKMGDHQRESFLTGVADALRYKALSAPDAADVVKRLFGNHLARRRLKTAFGDDKKGFAKFEMTMKNEAAMADTHAKVNIGSRTTPMAMDEASFGKAAGMVGDVLMAGQGSPGHAVRIGSGVMDAISTPPEAVAKHVTRMLTNDSSMAKRAAIEALIAGPTAPHRLGLLGRGPVVGATGLLSGR